MEYSKMTKEQLVTEIAARESEVQVIRDSIESSKALDPSEWSGLRWTYCLECGNRVVDAAGCNSCSAAKAVFVASQNGRS